MNKQMNEQTNKQTNKQTAYLQIQFVLEICYCSGLDIRCEWSFRLCGGYGGRKCQERTYVYGAITISFFLIFLIFTETKKVPLLNLITNCDPYLWSGR